MHVVGHRNLKRIGQERMTEKTLEQLQEEHAEMLATSYDIGLEVPEELKADFADAGAGATINSALDALIREYRDQKGDGLATDGEGEHTEAEASSEVAPPKKPKKARPKKAKPAKVAETPPTSGETDVAVVKAEKTSERKASAKKAKAPAAKKAGAAKKAPGKKAAANARKPVVARAPKFDEGAKITRTGKENPSRAESGRGQRIANVLKHNGKTLKTFFASGGKQGTLNWCVKNGLVKVA
jgi:hypothetical protein